MTFLIATVRRCKINPRKHDPPFWPAQSAHLAPLATGFVCETLEMHCNFNLSLALSAMCVALLDTLASVLFQSENSALWLHGSGSRTMSAVPANTYYGFQGQNQQTSGFRQGQQPPSQQCYGSLGGYPHFYNSQAGISLDQQQQQNLRDGSLVGSQGQPKQQQQSQQQIWQNSY